MSFTHNLFKFTMILLLGLALASCNKSSTDTQEGAEGEQTEEVSADTEATEETEGEEDKSQRPSPPREVSATQNGATFTINYSSPGVKGREVWGGLVPYDQVWRTGANEATTFEVDKDVTINGQALPAGKYAFFAIPTAGDWTLIFNTVADQWGAYEYDESKDALRVTATPQMVDEVQERLEFTIGEGGNVVLAWDKVRVPFTVAVAQ